MKKKIFLTIAAVLLSFSSLCLTGCDREYVEAVINNDSAYLTKKELEESYYDKAKKCLEKDMQCPGTAVYPDISDIEINASLTSPVVYINSYYDAENLMGALVRVYYSITFEYDENGDEVYKITYK